jgi:hypothetical protein
MKLLIVFLIFSIHNIASASNLLQGYECKSAEDALHCNNKCSKANYKLEFKVNERANKIIRFSLVDKNLTQSVSFENCNVVDDRNWVCEEYSEFGFSNAVMRNGQYAHTTTTEKKYKGGLMDKNFCAK